MQSKVINFSSAYNNYCVQPPLLKDSEVDYACLNNNAGE